MVPDFPPIRFLVGHDFCPFVVDDDLSIGDCADRDGCGATGFAEPDRIVKCNMVTPSGAAGHDKVVGDQDEIGG